MNVLLPLVLALVLLSGFARREKDALPALLVLVQFAFFFYDPRGRLPSREHLRYCQDAVAAISRLPGDVWVPARGAFSSLAGKSMHINFIAYWDVFRKREPEPELGRLLAETRGLLERRAFGAIVVENGGGLSWFHGMVLKPEIERYYFKSGELLSQPFAGGPSCLPMDVYLPLQHQKNQNRIIAFIRPEKPVENAYIESFNEKFRDKCLNENWSTSLRDTRQMIEAWRKE